MSKLSHHQIVKQRCLTTREKIIFKPTQQDAGFTLLEIFVMVVIVGVLAAIVAPSWLGFVNRQRVNKANDAILAALQEAQRQAIKTKSNYSVSFKIEGNVPKMAIYADPNPAISITPVWKTLGGDLGIKPGQVLLLSNLISGNTAGTSTSLENLNTPKTITFDYMGTLANANFGTPATGSSDSPGLKVVVAERRPGLIPTAGSMKRCVIIKTLIGGMITGKDSNCN
jgi:type II secretory pathway pseudopilin PulG